MSAVAGDADDQANMWRVLAAWVADRPREGSGERLLDLSLSPSPPWMPLTFGKESAERNGPSMWRLASAGP